MSTAQKGTELEIGLGFYTLSGYITEDANITPIAEIEVIKGENNETTTKLISDPGKEITLNCIVKSGTDIEFEIGDTITINNVGYMIEPGSSVSRSRGAARLSLNLKKEDSMTYSA